eukprot:jgi/Psemu1/11928/gm1.11928_g
MALPCSSSKRQRRIRSRRQQSPSSSQHIPPCRRSMALRILPWCVANAVVVWVLLWILDGKHEWTPPLLLSSADYCAGCAPPQSLLITTGILVACLLVASTQESLRRCRAHRSALDKILRSTSTLVRTAVVISRRHKTNSTQHRPSREWRSELAYRGLLVARTAASNAEYPGSVHNRNRNAPVPAYEGTDLGGIELDECLPSKERAEGSRVPVSEGLWSFAEDRLAHPMSPEHELALLAMVDSMMEGYHDLEALMVTPVPALYSGLVRGLAIGYAAMLPLVAVWEIRSGSGSRIDDTDSGDSDFAAAASIVVAFLTAALVGLLAVQSDLDDPFATGNVWDAAGIAEYCAEDVVRAIHVADGPEWAGALRYRTHRKAVACRPIPVGVGKAEAEEKGGVRDTAKANSKTNANDGDGDVATETDRLLPEGSDDSTLRDDDDDNDDNGTFVFGNGHGHGNETEWHDDDSIYFRSRASMPDWMVGSSA